MISTIRLPKDMVKLNPLLPKPQYNYDECEKEKHDYKQNSDYQLYTA